LALVAGLACLLLALPLQAQPARKAVPEELEPWVPWVLEEIGDGICTRVGKEPVCVWPGRLVVDVEQDGADFRLSVYSERRTFVPLPGSEAHWPRHVKLDAEELVVLARGGQPVVTLPAGTHQITGRFDWPKPPDLLPAPAAIARVRVVHGDRQIDHPRRNADGSVWLDAEAPTPDAQAEPERLDMEVFRHLADGVPMMVTTRLKLRVAGRPREVSLGDPLLAGSVLSSLDSGDLAARFGSDGELLLELRSGKHTVNVTARYAKPPAALKVGEHAKPWPADEVWVWEPSDALRRVAVGGAERIDPSRTNLPAEWRRLQAFRLRPPAALTLKTVQRGEAEPPPNRLRLERTIWLDEDGRGFTARDLLAGEMHRDWRLDFSAGELGRVVVNRADQLITVDQETKLAGVEIREGKVQLMAEWRAPLTGALPAGGWSTDLEEVDTTVHLPPGWELAAARGVDVVSMSWWHRFTLAGVVLMVLLALAVGRLCKPSWGALTLLTLALCQGIDEAPSLAWIVPVGAIALLQRLPAGRLRTGIRVAWWGGVAVLALVLVDFGVAELRRSLFPQSDYALLGAIDDRQEALLEVRETEQIAMENADNREGGTGTRAKGEEGSMGAPQAAAAPWGRDDSLGIDPTKQEMTRRRVKTTVSDETIVQTGPGVPDWQWATWKLQWSGPVPRDQQATLYLLGPLERGVLSVLRVVLAFWLGLVLFRFGGRLAPVTRRSTKGAAAAAATVAVLLTGWSAPAQAQIPSADMLQALKERLTAAAPCGDQCLSVSSATLRVREQTFQMEAEVHVGATTSYPLPGPASAWVPRRVEVDGRPSSALALAGEFLHLRLTPGRHQVSISGPIGAGGLTLDLGVRPRNVTVSAPGWTVDGVADDGRAEQTIHLSRAADAATPADGTPAESEPSAPTVPPWLSITRTFQVGVTWKVRTTVRRVSAKGAPVVVRFPLLEGERLTSPDATAEDGALVISLDRNATEAKFDSSLDPRETIELRAASKQPWSEAWVLDCDAIWRCEPSGIAPDAGSAGETWQPVYHPWPGEKLSVRFTRPPPAEGNSVTIDRARLVLTPDERGTDATLSFDLRTSTGGIHRLTLPTDARVSRLTVEGRTQATELRDGALELDLAPGPSKVELELKHKQGMGVRYQVPQVGLGTTVANARVEVRLPVDRWPLWASGGRWAPKVTYWFYLALLLAGAALLGRRRRSPLKTWQWALLAVGFVSPAPAVVLVPVAWFFVIEWRRRAEPANRRLRNATQVGIALLTLLFVVTLLVVVVVGLTEAPWMHIEGDGSRATQLAWYAPRLAGDLPNPWVLSTTVWVWRLLVAAWACWLGYSLLGWLRSAWQSFKRGGVWLRAPAAAVAAAGEAAPSAAAAPTPTEDPSADEKDEES
jgi:hypothetical protein